MTKAPDGLRRVYRAGAREGLLLPGVPGTSVPSPVRRGRRRNQGTKEPPHRPVRSTVNACSLPPLTTILLSPSRSRSFSDDLEREPRTPILSSRPRSRSCDPRMTRRRSSFRGRDVSSVTFLWCARKTAILFQILDGT